MSAKEWYLYDRGTPPVGPLSSREVLDQHASGSLSKNALLCPVEGGDWTPIADRLAVLQARTAEAVPPWFIFREGSAPLGPLTDALLQRGVEADRVPTDALLGRANTTAWYSRARALAEPPPSLPPTTQAASVPPPSHDERRETTALRSAVVMPAPDPIARQRTILLGFCALPLVLGAVLFALIPGRPAPPPPPARPAAPAAASASAPASASAAPAASAARVE